MIVQSNRIGVSKRVVSIFKIGIMFLFIFAFGLSQEPPEDFEFEISIFQSFYFFLESDIDGNPLESMQIYRNQWKSAKISGNQRKSVKISENRPNIY